MVMERLKKLLSGLGRSRGSGKLSSSGSPALPATPSPRRNAANQRKANNGAGRVPRPSPRPANQRAANGARGANNAARARGNLPNARSLGAWVKATEAAQRATLSKTSKVGWMTKQNEHRNATPRLGAANRAGAARNQLREMKRLANDVEGSVQRLRVQARRLRALRGISGAVVAEADRDVIYATQLSLDAKKQVKQFERNAVIPRSDSYDKAGPFVLHHGRVRFDPFVSVKNHALAVKFARRDELLIDGPTNWVPVGGEDEDVNVPRIRRLLASHHDVWSDANVKFLANRTRRARARAATHVRMMDWERALLAREKTASRIAPRAPSVRHDNNTLNNSMLTPRKLTKRDDTNAVLTNADRLRMFDEYNPPTRPSRFKKKPLTIGELFGNLGKLAN
jgi:hypothetical protein